MVIHGCTCPGKAKHRQILPNAKNQNISKYIYIISIDFPYIMMTCFAMLLRHFSCYFGK